MENRPSPHAETPEQLTIRTALASEGFTETMVKQPDGGLTRVHFRCGPDALASLCAVTDALAGIMLAVVHVQLETGSWSFVDVASAANQSPGPPPASRMRS